MKINGVLKDYLQLIDEVLKEGVEKGEFRPSLNIQLARQMIFGTIDETVTTWVMNDQKYDLPALSSEVGEMLLNGFSIR